MSSAKRHSAAPYNTFYDNTISSKQDDHQPLQKSQGVKLLKLLLFIEYDAHQDGSDAGDVSKLGEAPQGKDSKCEVFHYFLRAK